MKKLLPLLVAGAVILPAAASAQESEILEAVYVTSISDNGRWILGQADGEGYLYVKDLKNDIDYLAGGNLKEDGQGYTAGLGKTISNDGTAIALVNGIPYYWTPTGGSNGTWKILPGNAVDGSAVVGSITPDGSMIVGACGSTGTSTDDVIMAKACYWLRNSDGTYGNPVYLPLPKGDAFGLVPQHVKCIAVSEDGNMISATMTSNSGFYETPIIYTRDDSGSWTMNDFSSAFLNPEGREVVRMPKNLDSYLPSPWVYLNDEEADAYMAAFQKWITEEPQASLDPGSDEYLKLQYLFMAEFMSDSNKEKYLKEYYAFMEDYDNLVAQNQAYYDFINYINTVGLNIVENNTCVSPDGKYAFFTGSRTIVEDSTQGEAGIYNVTFPIRLDPATGEVKEYHGTDNHVLTSVAADYSILCRNVGLDAYWPGAGWIYPRGSENGMSIPDYIMANGSEDAYEWMEENMYKEVIKGITSEGTPSYDDSWVVGIPYCTPDLSYIACANSPMYWADSYYSDRFNYVSFLLETGISLSNNDNSVGSVEDTETVGTEIFDLSGRRVNAPVSGIYIVRETKADGKTISKKVVLNR